jgi:hypothetical protein
MDKHAHRVLIQAVSTSVAFGQKPESVLPTSIAARVSLIRRAIKTSQRDMLLTGYISIAPITTHQTTRRLLLEGILSLESYGEEYTKLSCCYCCCCAVLLSSCSSPPGGLYTILA